VELMPYFDSEVILRVATLRTSDLAALIEPLAQIEAVVSPALTLEMVEGPLLAHFSECDGLWSRMCENYPAESATVGPKVVEDQQEGVPQFDFSDSQ